MIEQAQFSLRGRNPDVLTCIANLSNDEVFTSPEFANQILDTLADAWAVSNNGADLWADKTVRFLDPFTKSGVFLREITSRLTIGLAEEIPDLEERVDHILMNSVSAGFGVIPFTGWDHLIQDINIPFTADIPAPGTGTVFLLLYLADADEIELATGEEVIVIDPFDHTAMEAFPVAIELIPEIAAP